MLPPERAHSRLSAVVGWLVPVCVLALIVWVNVLRVQRVQRVSSFGLPAASTEAAPPPAGAQPYQNRLIIPEHNADSFHWIVQTQQMLATGESRVRRIAYENAPFGRDVHDASAYRWWLGALARADHRLYGTPLAAAVERAALVADPLLHLLLVLVVSAFAGSRFGGWAAAGAAAVGGAAFPFASEFLGGAPDDHGLMHAALIASLLPLVAGLLPRRGTTVPNAKIWFFVAGCFGGLGLWISVSASVPLMLGVAVGGIVAGFAARSAAGEERAAPGAAPATWRAWGLGGALGSVAAYLIEFAPGQLGQWELRAVHPLYSLAWIGLAECVAQAVTVIESRGRPSWRRSLVGVLAVATAAAPAYVMWKLQTRGFLATDVSSFQLAKTSSGAGALNLWAWLVRHGLNGSIVATLSILGVLLPLAWLVLRRETPRACRAAALLLSAPLLVAVTFGAWQLSWWSRVDAIATVLVVVLLSQRAVWQGRLIRWFVPVALAPAIVAGILQLRSGAASGAENALSEREIFGLIERDLAQFLATRTAPKPALALAPPAATPALFYYAGVRGLGTLSWENPDGLSASVRILSAWQPEEAKELIDRRGVTHLILPSWDAYMDEYARMGMGQLENTFLERLRFWRLPPWLRAIPYELPTIAGYEGQSVIVLEVVEDQDDAPALSRLAEYFVEMSMLDAAATTGQGVRRFPADLGAVVARGQVELARGDTAAFARTVAQIKPRLTSGGDRNLPWDRRVSLAVLLARAKLPELAKEQAKRCSAEATEARLRFLTTGSVYQLLVLQKAYQLEFKDPHLRPLAMSLLPPAWRERLTR